MRDNINVLQISNQFSFLVEDISKRIIELKERYNIIREYIEYDGDTSKAEFDVMLECKIINLETCHIHHLLDLVAKDYHDVRILGVKVVDSFYQVIDDILTSIMEKTINYLNNNGFDWDGE